MTTDSPNLGINDGACCCPRNDCRCCPDPPDACAVHPDRPGVAHAGGEWACGECVDEVNVIEWIEALTGTLARAGIDGVIEVAS